jgi:uncharacterized protein YegP (UPF0339 family)
MKVQIYQGKNKKWYWRVVARNGRIIADGAQGYASKANVKRAFRNFVSDAWMNL